MSAFSSPPFSRPVERLFYRALGSSPDRGQDWKSYARTMLVFSAVSRDVVLYVILRTQGIQPFNPEGFDSMPWDVTFNTDDLVRHQHELAVLRRRDDAVLLLPDGGLAVQNFVSAAVGIAVSSR